MKYQFVFALAALACVALCTASPVPAPEPLFGLEKISSFIKNTFEDFKGLTPLEIFQSVTDDILDALPIDPKTKEAILQFREITPEDLVQKIKESPIYEKAVGFIENLDEKLKAILYKQ